jgi:hypothetical protein
MNWEQIGAIGETLGAVGIISSVLYPAYQVRGDREATLASTRQLRQNGVRESMLLLAVSERLTPILARIGEIVHSVIRRILLRSLLVLVPLTAVAENSDERQFGPIIWGLDGGVVHQFSTDFSDTDGAFSVNRYFIQPSVGYAWDQRNRVSLSFGFGESDYDFSSGTTIDGLEPWGSVRDYQLSMPIRFSPTKRSDVYIRPSVRSYAENGASMNDGRTEGLIAGISWVVSESLTIGPGVGWYTKLGGGSHAFPILIIDWAITERLSLTTGRGLAASQGPGLTLNYRLSEKWRLGMIGRIEKIRFALDDEGPVSEGYGKDRSLPLFFSVAYEPWLRTSVSAFFGVEFDGQLALKDEDGRTIFREDYDVPLLIGLAFRSRF